jgi:hypothetical protein
MSRLDDLRKHLEGFRAVTLDWRFGPTSMRGEPAGPIDDGSQDNVS